MTCFNPVEGFRGAGGSFVLDKRKSPTGAPMTVPCGKCTGCKAVRYSSWAARISHEAALHEENCFITLTYDDGHLPEDFSVDVRVVQLFIKRLRKKIGSKRIRYFAVGEYGTQGGRPHYHLIIFGYGFPDKILSRVTEQNHRCYVSEELGKLWEYGLHEIGSVTASSAAYCGRYSLKKVGGTASKEAYTRVHPLTGEIVRVHPEFATMSTHPGIGYHWFKKFEKDCFPSDFLILEGRKVPVPSYYQKKLRGRYEHVSSDAGALLDRDDLYDVRKKRREGLEASASNRTPERLAVRAESHRLKVEKLKREL